MSYAHLDCSPVWLYAHPSMTTLAKQIVEACSRQNSTPTSPSGSESKLNPELRRTASMSNIIVQRSRSVVFRDTIKWEKFADGFPNVFIQDVKQMAGKDVIFLGSFHSPEIIFEQLSVLIMFPKYLARSFHFILPYFPTGTMERVDLEGQIATAKTLATLMSAIPLTTKGPAQICIFDIHALQERFYFSDNIIPSDLLEHSGMTLSHQDLPTDLNHFSSSSNRLNTANHRVAIEFTLKLETAIPLLLSAIEKLADKDQIVFAFPDDGAYKRFHCFFPEDNMITCVKIRDGKQRIVKVKDGNPQGKHVVIVDDLVQTGGTLKECGKALLEKGATSISAYVTHPVFPNKSWEKFLNSDVKFQHFWITDSIPHAIEISQHRPFHLLSLCRPISDMLMGYDLLPFA